MRVGFLDSGNWVLNGLIIQQYSPTVSITVTSSPATGTGYIMFNGTAETTPYVVTCGIGDTETIAANSPANLVSGQSQYVWSSWSDSGAQSHSFIASSSTTMYTATFQPQYYLNATYSAVEGVGWYDSGSTAYATLVNGTVSGGTGSQVCLH